MAREKILETVTREWKDTRIKTIVISMGRVDSITGIILVPLQGEGKHPAVLELHGYTDRKEAWIEPDGYSSKSGRVTRYTSRSLQNTKAAIAFHPNTRFEPQVGSYDFSVKINKQKKSPAL